jgi:16S rRNA U516 pseudouridylate synthase RsuA-like enzyme
MAKERLQKIMAHAGYGSRRACEKIITENHGARRLRLAPRL